VSAVGFNQALNVAWTPPLTVGSSAVSRYVVQVRRSNGTWADATKARAAARSARVTGLSNARPSRVRVIAVNAVGRSLGSSVVQRRPIATVAVALGDNSTCAVLRDRQLSCWGENARNELAIMSDTENRMSATRVGVNALDYDNARDHTCVVLTDGTVRCWGEDEDGQLDGTPGDVGPVVVPGITDATAVALGREHSCALRRSGKVACWGQNARGQSGDGTMTSPAAPKDVLTLTDIVEIDAGDAHTCARSVIGEVWCWGQGAASQLGDGEYLWRSTPVRAKGVTDATSLSVGNEHTCATVASGEVWCWGLASSLQTGYVPFPTVRSDPFPVEGIDDAVDVATGDSHTCIVRRDGTAACWGSQRYGRLGNGVSAELATPEPQTVIGLTDAAAVDAGSQHTCALLRTGAVSCWGVGVLGQLGNGVPSFGMPTPVRVRGL
jgi:alpha-tubulin suppressor-like RCC1 family protein